MENGRLFGNGGKLFFYLLIIFLKYFVLLFYSNTKWNFYLRFFDSFGLEAKCFPDEKVDRLNGSNLLCSYLILSLGFHPDTLVALSTKAFVAYKNSAVNWLFQRLT